MASNYPYSMIVTPPPVQGFQLPSIPLNIGPLIGFKNDKPSNPAPVFKVPELPIKKRSRKASKLESQDVPPTKRIRVATSSPSPSQPAGTLPPRMKVGTSSTLAVQLARFLPPGIQVATSLPASTQPTHLSPPQIQVTTLSPTSVQPPVQPPAKSAALPKVQSNASIPLKIKEIRVFGDKYPPEGQVWVQEEQSPSSRSGLRSGFRHGAVDCVLAPNFHDRLVHGLAPDTRRNARFEEFGRVRRERFLSYFAKKVALSKIPAPLEPPGYASDDPSNIFCDECVRPCCGYHPYVAMT